MPINVLIVESDPFSLRIIRDVVSSDPDLRIVREQSALEAGDPEELDLAIVNCSAANTGEAAHSALPPHVPLICTDVTCDGLWPREHGRILQVAAPLRPESLTKALLRAKDVLLQRRLEDLGNLFAAYGGPRQQPNGPSPIPVRNGNSVLLLPPASIEWVNSKGNCVVIHSAQGVHTARMTLNQLEGLLRSTNIVRIHRKNLANLDRVLRVIADDERSIHLVLQSGQRLRVSRSYRRKVRELVLGEGSDAANPSVSFRPGWQEAREAFIRT